MTELAAHLLQAGFQVGRRHLNGLRLGQGPQGQVAAQALFGLRAGGFHQAANQILGEELLHIHSLLGDLAGGLFDQLANFLLDQGFWQFHLQLLHQGRQQGLLAIIAVPAFAVLLEAGFEIGPQFGQGALVTGLLGEGIVQGGEFVGFEIQQGDLEAGLAASGLLLGV